MPLKTMASKASALKDDRRGQGSRRAWTSSGLEAAEVRLPQNSVDIVVGGALPVAMETVLQGAGTVFTLWSCAVFLVVCSQLSV